MNLSACFNLNQSKPCLVFVKKENFGIYIPSDSIKQIILNVAIYLCLIDAVLGEVDDNKVDYT